jgi:hypothetical protein
LHITFLLWEHLIKLISEVSKSLVQGRDFYWEISLPGDIRNNYHLEYIENSLNTISLASI